MSRKERLAAVRRKKNYIMSSVLFGWLGSGLNRSNRFAYLSYVPDAIRENDTMPGFRGTVTTWIKNNAPGNAGDLPRMLLLLQNAERVVADRVPGHFAELGVYKGHSARLLADIITRLDPQRRIYLFDTFDGFDARDLEGIDADVRRLFADTSLATVKSFVGHSESCDFRPGYFPKSAEGIEPDSRFAFVHLDCDLYEPMRAALAFFYPRLSSGALVVIHDYSSGHWPGVPQAVAEYLEDKPERLVLMPDKSGTAVFRKH
jgi:hypothetical protein